MNRQQRWQAEHPMARWAHVALASAIRRGIVKREGCAVCGNPRTDGHHADYSKPAEVTWLCRKHHREEHRRLRAASGERT
jgi:hypothetical protein